MMNKIGLDHYKCVLSPLEVVRKCRSVQIPCYRIEKIGEETFFSLRIIDRKKIKSILPSAVLLYTSGVLGMLIRTFSRKDHFFSMLFALLIWNILSFSVFKIDVIGEKDDLSNKIENYCEKYQYRFRDIKKMKKDLLKTFEDEITWLEVYHKGSIVKIRYAAKKKIEENKVSDAPLVAKKDGMIVSFKGASGVKVKKVNDLVKTNDILVDNKGIDSNGEEYHVKVKGQVFAHTWQKIVVEYDKNKLPDVVNYYSMLMEARNQLNIDYEWGEKIVSENVLQFTHKQDKMILEILYTLLEDISS